MAEAERLALQAELTQLRIDTDAARVAYEAEDTNYEVLRYARPLVADDFAQNALLEASNTTRRELRKTFDGLSGKHGRLISRIANNSRGLFRTIPGKHNATTYNRNQDNTAP